MKEGKTMYQTDMYEGILAETTTLRGFHGIRSTLISPGR